MLERFTGDARECVRLAQEEAREMRSACIGTEHLLIGLALGPGSAGQALAAQGVNAGSLQRRLRAGADDELDGEALASLGIDLDRVREATEAHLGPGALDKPKSPPRSGHLPVSKRVKKVLELALREAVHRQDGEIRSGHILLGILRDGAGPAIELLRAQGVDLQRLRDEVHERIGDRAA